MRISLKNLGPKSLAAQRRTRFEREHEAMGWIAFSERGSGLAGITSSEKIGGTVISASGACSGLLR